MNQILIISCQYSQIQQLREVLSLQPDRYRLCGMADNTVLGMNLIESTDPDVVIMPAKMNFWGAEDLINYLLPRGRCPAFLLLADRDPELGSSAMTQVSAILPETSLSQNDLLAALETACAREEKGPRQAHSDMNAVQHSLEVMELLMGLRPLPTREAQQEFGRLRVGRRDCWLLLGGVPPQVPDDFDFLTDLDRLERAFLSLPEVLRPLGPCEICVYQERNLCILLEDGQRTEPDWTVWTGRLNSALEKLGLPPLLFEISDTPRPLEQWHRQCRELMKLRQMRFFHSPPYLQPKFKTAYERFVPQEELLEQLSALAQALQARRAEQLRPILETLEEAVCHSLSREVYSYVISQMLLQYNHLCYAQSVTAGDEGLRLNAHRTVSDFFRAYREAVGRLLAQSQGEEPEQNPIIAQVRRYIQDHLAESLSLEVLADHVHVSPSYLSRLFRRETGGTINSFVTGQRTQEAMRLLRETDRRITDIADLTGFESAKYFSYVFKKELGQTPQAYRKAKKEDAQ